MSGYGEFFWPDGKKYCGFYHKDKKEGLGVYYWTTDKSLNTKNLKVYVGFWSQGKQNGIGKLFSSKGIKYGLFENGERKYWFESEEDAMSKIEKAFHSIFALSLTEINEFFDD